MKCQKLWKIYLTYKLDLWLAWLLNKFIILLTPSYIYSGKFSHGLIYDNKGNYKHVSWKGQAFVELMERKQEEEKRTGQRKNYDKPNVCIFLFQFLSAIKKNAILPFQQYGGATGYYTKRNKSEKQIPYDFTHVEFKKQNRWT